MQTSPFSSSPTLIGDSLKRARPSLLLSSINSLGSADPQRGRGFLFRRTTCAKEIVLANVYCARGDRADSPGFVLAPAAWMLHAEPSATVPTERIGSGSGEQPPAGTRSQYPLDAYRLLPRGQRGGAVAARGAHNPEVVGSIPTRATFLDHNSVIQEDVRTPRGQFPGAFSPRLVPVLPGRAFLFRGNPENKHGRTRP